MTRYSGFEPLSTVHNDGINPIYSKDYWVIHAVFSVQKSHSAPSPTHY